MEYVVNLFMHSEFQLEDFRMLLQLIEHRYPKGIANVALYDDMLRISLWKQAIEEWNSFESNFFDGLKLMDLIVRWEATKL